MARKKNGREPDRDPEDRAPGSRKAALRAVLERRADDSLASLFAPPFGGGWRDADRETGAALLARVTLMLAKGGDRDPWPLTHEAWALRSLRLKCYEGVELYDVILRDRIGQIGRAAFFVRGGDPSLLDNSSAPLHELNEDHPPKLDEAAAAGEYLKMFCWLVCGDNGPFQIVEDASLLPPDLPASVRDRLAERELALTVREPPAEPPADPDEEAADDEPLARPSADELAAMPPEERAKIFERILREPEPARPRPCFLADAAVYYGGSLFRSEFAIMANGMVEMIDDEPLMEVTLTPVWRMANPLRYHLDARTVEA